ncbi:hypothetical protein [Leptolinea tardivitalis]|uniref:GGDEF domain-containing protein n=1 Tax=Leptolinea tardivitalis TaxID=229920 RepID=A0A0P6XFN8_9CHLR|nr:hypothetical protein [Leptolinea tardivitalis]KPL74017.1 hypothetical protein ADM99_01925 [Leptolinea tardivitalis]GAP22655.1 protein containing FOG: GGDEF domain [Leptolinea tardivitalis]
MRKLKLSLVVLLIYLTLTFNFERLEYKAGFSGVGVHSFVYALLISAILVIFLVPQIQRFSIFIFFFLTSVVYFALRLTFFNDAPIFEGMSTYVTITELAFLILGITLAYRCTKYMGEFEKFVEEVYIPNLGKRILNMESASEEVKTEFIRSRRHQTPMALLAVQPSSSSKKDEEEIKRTVAEIQRHMTSRFISASLAKIITSEARRSDLIISREEDGQFLILCPETKGTSSLVLAERIRKAAEKHLGLQINYGMASFPEEAYTFEEMVQRAIFQMNNVPTDIKVVEPSSLVYEEANRIK